MVLVGSLSGWPERRKIEKWGNVEERGGGKGRGKRGKGEI